MNKFMKMAIREAYSGIEKGHGGPFGAVIVKDGKVIAKGHNTVILKQDATCHGEVNAIRKASRKLGGYDLSGCDIYTTAEPCPMCLGAIMWANISKVFYGCDIEDTEDIGFRDKKFYSMTDKERSEFVKEIDREDCLKLYGHYKAMKDKTEY